MKKALITLAAFVLLAPMVALLGVGVLVNPAAAYCVTGTGTSSLNVGTIPDQLQVTTANGETFTLNQTQLTRAASIITVGSRIEGVNRDAIIISLMAALTESSLRQLSNTGAYPESASYDSDGDGGDHDSLGLFQMRPSTGWGSVAELMDVDYQIAAFFGGEHGPNFPSPRGLLDIPGWQEMDKGAAAQSVEVSAFPDRYRNYEPVARLILDTLTSTPTAPGTSTGPSGPPLAVGAGRVVFPLPADTWVMTSPFGMRVHPVTGEYTLHGGTDFAAPDGTPILAVADGTVRIAETSGTYGGLVVIEHTIDGKIVASAYAHSWPDGIHVQPGDQVRAGQHIADVGSSGRSTGPHLHFEIRDGGTHGTFIDSAAWLDAHGAADLPEAVTGAPSRDCQATSALAPDTGIAPPVRNPDGSWPAESCSLPDPTQPSRDGACLTPRTARIVEQIEAMNTGHDGIYCWDPHAWNPTSDHPKGRACDLTFGAIGQFATGSDKTAGDQLADWLVANADTWGVSYVIWYGRIWSSSRADEGWRHYDGGGIYDINDPTGQHSDHIHLSML